MIQANRRRKWEGNEAYTCWGTREVVIKGGEHLTAFTVVGSFLACHQLYIN